MPRLMRLKLESGDLAGWRRYSGRIIECWNVLLSFNLGPQRLLCLARDCAFVKQVCLDEKIGFLAEGVVALEETGLTTERCNSAGCPRHKRLWMSAIQDQSRWDSRSSRNIDKRCAIDAGRQAI